MIQNTLAISEHPYLNLRLLNDGRQIRRVDDAYIIGHIPVIILAIDDGPLDEMWEHLPVVPDEKRVGHERKLLRVLLG